MAKNNNKKNDLKDTVPTKAEQKEIEKLVEEQKENIAISVCAYCSTDISNQGAPAEIKQESKKLEGEDITVYVAKCQSCAANNTQNSPNLVVFQDEEDNILEVKYGDLA